MPLPTPNKNESNENFIDRCMGNPTMNEEYPDESQRRAVCESQWERKDMIKAKGTSAEVLIYDDIGEGWFGGISAKAFAEDIKKLGNIKKIDVRINSYGGSVFDGLAIYNTLKKHSAEVSVAIDGIAASIASIIAMAGDTISIAENGFLMIHDPWSVAMGTAEDLRSEADVMDKVRDSLLDTYMNKATVSRQEISDMMSNETWLTAKEAANTGLVDTLVEETKLAACGNKEILKQFHKIPDSLKQQEKPKLNMAKINAATMQQTLRKLKI